MVPPPVSPRLPAFTIMIRYLVSVLLAAVAGLCVAAQPAFARLSYEHADIGIVYDAAAETNRLNIVVNDDNHLQTYAHDQVALVAAEASRLELPDGTPFGPGGAPLWVLPQSQYDGILYLGLSTEAIAPDAFMGALGMRLVSVDLPARQETNLTERFFVWQAGQFGDFDVLANSTDGLTPLDTLSLTAGGHAHCNWGFSTSGLWYLTFQALGQVAGEPTNIVSTNITLAFHVLPLSPFEQWITTNWPPSTPRSVVGPAADPDGDGMPNLVEYALGLDPNDSARTGFPAVSVVEIGGQHYAAVNYSRPRAATDVTTEVLATDKLPATAWVPLTAPPTVIDLGDRERVIVRDAVPLAPGQVRFYRLCAYLRQRN